MFFFDVGGGSLRAMDVSAIGLRRCATVYLRLGEELGELDSLIFSRRNSASFYFLIMLSN